MRLIRLTTHYLAYLKQFYARHPNLIQASFQQQYASLMADYFSWSDVWGQTLAPLRLSQLGTDWECKTIADGLGQRKPDSLSANHLV